MGLLDSLAELSREFGTPEYVKSGGGNGSAKNADTLWVKPSGTNMADVSPESCVAMDRTKLALLYEADPPSDPNARETMVKDIMLAAVLPGTSGRPSVEAPLHDSFQATFVMHTHPALVNGLTCSQSGSEACGELFPDALWLDYTDPGYTLSMHLREKMRAFMVSTGREPTVVFLQNHGICVAGSSPDELRMTHGKIMTRLRQHYTEAGVSTKLPLATTPPAETVEAATRELRHSLGDENALHVRVSGFFPVAEGPISPDHIVHMKAQPLTGEPTPEAVAHFAEVHEYSPRVIVCKDGVFAVGRTKPGADAAMELALDGALVKQLAGAFGGIRYMDAGAERFIDNWEVEAYRRRLAAE